MLIHMFFSPEILKEDIKVFFVKYNDPIYVKLEKLDIMIRLAGPGNIGNVLAELKEWVLTWVIFSYKDMDVTHCS